MKRPTRSCAQLLLIASTIGLVACAGVEREMPEFTVFDPKEQRLRDRTGRITAALAALIALVSFTPMPAGVPVLLAAVAALVVGLVEAGPSRARDVEQPEGDLL